MKTLLASVAHSNSPIKSGNNILIVEDEAVIAMDLQRRLEQLGYGVTAIASTGVEALAEMDRCRPNLVLMDIQLEGGHAGINIDGVETARRIAAKYPVPVIFVTSFTDEATVTRAGLCGPSGYIVKPFTDRDLSTAIQIALHRHVLEQRLAAEREWLSSIVNSVGDALLATDGAGIVRLLNPAAERFTGWNEALAIGRSYREILTLLDCDSGRTVDPIGLALSDGEQSQGRLFRLIDQNGREFFIEECTNVISAEGNLLGVIFVFRDVADRIEKERELRHFREKESIGRLCGGVAHDFNNHLAVILGNSILGIRESTAHPPLRQRFSSISEAAERATERTQQLLALAGLQVLHSERCDIHDILLGLRLTALPLLRSFIQFDLHLDAPRSIVSVDRTQLHQALLNVVLHARDSIPANGSISIATSNCGGMLVIAIEDNGVGMEPEKAATIFEPFPAGAQAGGVSSLGLSTTKGIVVQSGGRIEVDSHFGVGSTFTIALPLAEEAPPSTEVAGETIPPATRCRLLAMLVEDNAGIREMEEEFLAEAGFAVVVASDGREALARFQEAPLAFDLVVTDVLMPHMNGVELARAILAIRPECPIILVSGFTAHNVHLKEFPASTVAFLQKPFHPDALMALVAKLLPALDA